jgi:hypothetical protein
MTTRHETLRSTRLNVHGVLYAVDDKGVVLDLPAQEAEYLGKIPGFVTDMTPLAGETAGLAGEAQPEPEAHPKVALVERPSKGRKDG